VPDQAVIDAARQSAANAPNDAPWDPDAQKAIVDQAQKQSDRLSSPNHRLPVKPGAFGSLGHADVPPAQ
jgi:hypothetical protein